MNSVKSALNADQDHNLKLLGHRYYDPTTGRFLTRDPIKDGRNWYSYCANNPISRTDPKGLEYHDPVQVEVDPEFEGTVIAYGDFPGLNDPKTRKWSPWRDSDGWRKTEIPPGYQSDLRMDVDLIIVIDKHGNAKIYFLPGKKGGSSHYRVNADGSISIVGNSAFLGAQSLDDMFGLMAYFYSTFQYLLIYIFGLLIGNTVSMWEDWMDKADKNGFPVEFTPRPRQ